MNLCHLVQAVLDHEAIAGLTSSKPAGMRRSQGGKEKTTEGTSGGPLSRPERKTNPLDDLLKKVKGALIACTTRISILKRRFECDIN